MMTSSPEPVEWLTSESDPMRVDWVDLAKAGRLARFVGSGARLGMTFLPGKFHDAPPLPLYRRDLETDVAALRDVHGVETLLLLVQDGEIVRAGVADLPDVLAAHDIELLRFPIPDMSVTSEREGLRGALDGVLDRLADGRVVAIACLAGRGRTGTVVACLLRDGGLDAGTAVALTRETRPYTIERESQVQFVRDWEWPVREALQ
jgi:atypical dual specificity phosphatase